jgi:adenosine kinase
MRIVLTGSIAYDYIMTFPGKFSDHLLPDRLDRISLSFLVDSLSRQRGGIAANIAYTLALLGDRPMILATAGEDFGEYRQWLEAHGVDTSTVRQVEGKLTASFFVNTDQANAQIASFYTGAMADAAELRLADLPLRPDLVVISPNDPAAMVQYARECQALGLPYIYDPSQQIVRLQKQELVEGISGCQAFFGNDYEAGLVEEKTGMDLPAISRHAQFAVITCGELGADIYTAEGKMHIPALTPVGLCDPTGVGDAFRGGFLKGYVHQLPIELCGKMGVLAATYCLEHQGTQGHHFTLPEFIERFRRDLGDHPELERLWPN